MEKRIILHLDMDAFFAQIEERENPQFKGKPIVVGAAPAGGQGRGVVATANYEARKYGIYSAMRISKAFQLCPNAVFLPVNMELYENTSHGIMKIVKKYSGVWEITGLDEAYLDISFLGDFEHSKKIAEKIKQEILEKEKLICTIGIGPNKTIAKMAVEAAKPNGLKIVRPEEVGEFLDSLDIEDLPGIGPKTAEKLHAVKIYKIGALKNLPKQKLRAMFGKWGIGLFEKSRGI